MTRLTLHVPESFNDGTPIGPEVFETVEHDLLNIGGGFTLTHGIGAWRGDDGRTYREHVRMYAVDVPDRDAAWPRLAALAERLTVALDQEAVYFTESEIAPALVERAVLNVTPARR